MKHYLSTLAFCLLLAGCSLPPQYTGEKYPATKHVDVYYAAYDARHHHYKVIGHLVETHHYSRSIIELDFSRYAKRMGADAIIITDSTADVLKYDN